ncbi:MAG: Nif3-like dinuclear metal center hexameric protein [Bacteroidales bacterium]|jgi:dinuclear metal center YbgI/SA1388 family protein|nr:Nif3-like dinuclear metal center hexameric protein [Bacteroidales bacterium]MCI1785677.1 Nif3-like dinuclear metal center hexameric protein [Bacteroidales bacterium]
MKVRQIADAIESFAPLSIQEEWDNSGLCIGSPESDVTSVLLGFDCTPALVDEAVRTGADMIVTHHPLIFNSLKKITPEDPTGLAVMKAISAGIAVYAAHTTADKVIGGVSGAMARKLGLENIRILEPESEDSGLGALGEFPDAVSCREATAIVKNRFGLKLVRTSKPLDCPIKKVAMCGGSGSSLISSAIDAGAQLYLCGDISYHRFFTPDNFMLMDIGHFESEKEIVFILFSLLKKKFPNFAVRISENIDKSNPVYYL